MILPVQLQPYAVLLRVAGVLIVLALAASAGAVVNGWRLNSTHANALAKRDAQIAGLQLSIEKQNSAVALMKQASDSANAARQRAEQEAIAQRKAAKARDEWISKLQGTCAENLKDAWGRM